MSNINSREEADKYRIENTDSRAFDFYVKTLNQNDIDILNLAYKQENETGVKC